MPVFLSLLAGCNSGADSGQVVVGTYRLPSDRIDQLLLLDDLPGLRVLIIDGSAPRKFSDAHVQALREWIGRGGVVWAEGDGVETTLISQISPVVVKDYVYRKSGTGKKGGELVVRGASPNLVISDHPLTAGVQQLYVFPARTFDGTKNALPILEMTDEQGSHGVVIAALSIGNGFVVLDGTSRKQSWIFGRIPDFDENHPHAVRQNGSWNSYDWATLVDNARGLASVPAAGMHSI
jgi:hypothetical protein